MVQNKSILEMIEEKDEVLFIFDSLFMDYAYIDYDVHCEEFRATISKHDLINDPLLISQINTLVQKLYEINE